MDRNERNTTLARVKACERRSFCRRVVAALMLFLVCTLTVLTASDALHERFHADAGHADHHCIVTLLAGGSVELAAAVVAVTAFALVCLSNFLPRTEVLLSAVPWQLLPGRAPPRFV